MSDDLTFFFLNLISFPLILFDMARFPVHTSSRLKAATNAMKYNLDTMFDHDIETFSVLHDFWLTTSSNPLDFLTTRCTYLFSIRISTFFLQ
ncbi:hypothetical protein K443DRAFT_417774 [Laccaria amethystina LaAM-08-1]|uniref:Uncharacterized protein n=1 Tax=Laccaria amethystina LaAM-08-1 TaxID=1095629 RepID=A0A0C9XHS4_9AGAR|nr:hypothetical protein K443DRAFT_417774 [Laccaria amethystina LaAM-08-1]